MILLSKNGSMHEVSTWRLNSTLLPVEQPVFPIFSFASGETVDSIAVHPDTQHLYSFGNKIMLSTDQGNKFKQIATVLSDVKSITMLPQQKSFVFVLQDGSVLYGKPGVHRMLQFDLTLHNLDSVLYDDMGNAYVLSVNTTSGVLNKQFIDFETLVQSHTEVGQTPLVYMPFSLHVSYLYEIAYSGITIATLNTGNVGQHIIQRHGADALIQNVTQVTGDSEVLSVVQIYHIQSFIREASDVSPALLSELDLVISNSALRDAWLVLHDDTAGGWQSTDVYKTIVLKFSTSVLLTQYVNTTHIQGLAIVPTVGDETFSVDNWYMVDLGFNHTTNEGMWYLQEGQCEHKVHFINKPFSTMSFVLDVDDDLTLRFHVEPTVEYLSDGTIVYPTYINPSLFVVSPTLTRHREYENITIHLRLRIAQMSVMTINLVSRLTSLLCDKNIYSFRISSGCPCRKKMSFWYPTYLSDEDYLSGNPVDNKGKKLLHSLPVNYRPPSVLGIAIPTSKYIYNVDPSRPVPNNKFKISQDTIQYNQCQNKQNVTECACTDDMRLTSDGLYSDCKTRVFRVSYPGKIIVNLTVENNGQSIEIGEGYAVMLWDVNGRYAIIETSNGSSLLVKNLMNLSRHQFGQPVYDPQGITITLNGSGLYHFRIEVVPGLSFCSLHNLYSEFQVFVDDVPFAYPILFILNFSTAFVFGGIIFLLYLYYLTNHNITRMRTIGERCPDTIINDQTEAMTGKYPPSKLLEK